MKKLLCLILSLLLILPPLPAHAWSEGGHHLIAVLAYRQMPKEKQQELIRILKAHPRYEQDFKVPKKVRNEEEWLVGRAAYWPDVARDEPEFNRPNWHYELGSCLNIGAVTPPAFPGSLPPGATLQTKQLHIAQAFDLCTKVFHDKSKPDSERAIALCWIAHLVGDAHQPCHAGSLYVEGLFPEGDRGANSIPTKQSKNMHALWDGLLGPKWDETSLNRRAAEMPKIELRAGGIDQWLNESRELAVTKVYTAEVLEPVSVAVRAKSKEVAEITLSENYLHEAGNLAKERAVEAGHRLASVLSIP